MKTKKYAITMFSFGVLMLGGSISASANSSSYKNGGYVNLISKSDGYFHKLGETSNNDYSRSLLRKSSKGKHLRPYKWHHVSGGYWIFGVHGTKVQSTYIHHSRSHTATAKNGHGVGPKVRASAGHTAFSQVNATLTHNKAYFGF